MKMKLKLLCLVLILSNSTLLTAASALPNSQSKHITKILSRGDGRSEQTAYKVRSVRDEYEILEALGLKPGKQSLVIRKKPYDVLEATDPTTGATRELWFDISSFYPEF
jgi:hypothetical protein